MERRVLQANRVQPLPRCLHSLRSKALTWPVTTKTPHRLMTLKFIQPSPSQGAVHSFQDENGTWWTYAFGEKGEYQSFHFQEFWGRLGLFSFSGVGTAQALGNSQQIMAILSVPRDEKEESGEVRV